MRGCNHLWSLASKDNGKTTYCWVCGDEVDDDAVAVWLPVSRDTVA